MITAPRHDYLLLTAVFILLIAAIGAAALHYGGATAAAGKITYHPCQALYTEYERNNCGWLPEQHECQKILVEMQKKYC